jgi:hypothetical protein
VAALAFASERGRADEPVVVVIESNYAQLQAGTIRRQIEDAGLPALTLAEDAARGTDTVTIVVDASGDSATVRLRGQTAIDASFRRGNRTAAAWLAQDVVNLVRRTRPAGAHATMPVEVARVPVGGEVLDPWSDGPARPRAEAPTPTQRSRVDSEVLDPWGPRTPSDPPRRASAPDVGRVPPVEVLDPWSDAPSRPARVRAHIRRTPDRRVHSEVLDPWRSEPADRLAPPRPHR